MLNMTTKPKPIYPNQYSVKLSSEAGEMLNKWIADFRHKRWHSFDQDAGGAKD